MLRMHKSKFPLYIPIIAELSINDHVPQLSLRTPPYTNAYLAKLALQVGFSFVLQSLSA